MNPRICYAVALGAYVEREVEIHNRRVLVDSGQCQLRYLALAGDLECGRDIWIGGCEFQWDVIFPGWVCKDATGKHVSPLGLQRNHLAQKRASVFPRAGNADKQFRFHVVGLTLT